MDRIKFGVCEFSFPYWGPWAVKMASEAGYSGIQLADGGGSMYSYPLNDKWIQDGYLESAAKYGVHLQSIHLYTLVRQGFIRSSLTSRDGEEGMESIKKGIIAASQMNIPVVMIEGMRMYGAAQRRHVFDMYKYAVEVADAYGVQIAMETDITMEEHFKFLDAFDGKLKLCFDTHNPCMYGTGYPPDMIRALGKDRMDHFHIKDNGGNRDGYVNVESPLVPFGTGITFFEESARAVKEIGFRGWIVSENMYYHPSMMKGAADYIDAARRDVEALKKAYGTEE